MIRWGILSPSVNPSKKKNRTMIAGRRKSNREKKKKKKGKIESSKSRE